MFKYGSRAPDTMAIWGIKTKCFKRYETFPNDKSFQNWTDQISKKQKKNKEHA